MINKSKLQTLSRVTDADINDIINTIRIAESRGAEFITTGLTENLKGKTFRDTAKNIWSFVRSNIRYREDGVNQVVKSPGALWVKRVGDCKSMTVFVASILQKMCVPYDLIVDFYDSDRPNAGHIYVKSKGIIIDPVNPVFNSADSAWKRKSIPGKTCRASLAGAAKIGNMNTIASYLHGLPGEGKAPHIPFNIINYSELTDGELSVKLAARQAEILYMGTGEARFKSQSDALNSIVDRQIEGDRVGAMNSAGALTAWAKQRLRTGDFPAVTAYYYSPQFKKDMSKIGQLSIEQYRQEEWRKCEEIRRQWADTPFLRFSRRKELRRSWESCFSSIQYLGVVNENLEKSAAHLLYNFGAGGPVEVRTKRILHKIAVENYSRVFGLSKTNIELWLRNGILAANVSGGAGAMDPEQTISFLRNNITRDNYDQIGNPLAVITTILKIVSVALAATQIILARISDVEKQRLIANTQGLGTESFGPEKSDFLSELTEDVIQSGSVWPLAALAAFVFLEK